MFKIHGGCLKSLSQEEGDESVNRTRPNMTSLFLTLVLGIGGLHRPRLWNLGPDEPDRRRLLAKTRSQYRYWGALRHSFSASSISSGI